MAGYPEPLLFGSVNGRGFTLIEILLTTAILVSCLCGLLAMYLNMFVVADLARDFLHATGAAQAKLEEIKEADFDNLAAFNATAFDLDGFAAGDSKGRVEVANTAYSDLITLRIICSFRSRGRLIGEDANLNGALSAGEDANNNGRLDSPVEIATLIAR